MDLQICKLNIALFLRAMLLLAPVTLLFYQENGLTAQELFFFQGLFYLTSIIFEIPIGYLSDMILRKKLLLLSFAVYLVMTLLWLFYKGYYIIMAGEILYAVSKVMLDNSMSGYLYDYLQKNQKADKMVKYYGYLNFYLALGTAAAAIFGTFLYSKYGSHTILWIQFAMIIVSITLVSTFTNIKPENTEIINLKKRVALFLENSKSIFNNTQIRYHILFSGILTSLSILFALSFQPLMKNALFPIFMFGVVSFMNHGIRSLAGVIAGKWLRGLNLQKIALPLVVNYIFGFILIFLALRFKLIPLVTVSIFLLCLIIGTQLIFTILHISRLHKFVPTENRGNIMSVNNLISRSAAAVILLSSKFFVNKIGFEVYYGIIFVLFVVICTYLALKIVKIKESNYWFNVNDDIDETPKLT